MDYLARIRDIEVTKETKKVCILGVTKEPLETKETKDTKEVTSHIPGVPVRTGDLIAWH